MITVGNVVAYASGQPQQGSDWHSDGSKLTLKGATPESRAGAALKCGPLKSISRVQGPQTSYRAELQGAVIFAELVDLGDSLTLDNQAVVGYGPNCPHREASDTDYRLQLAPLIRRKETPLRWIPGHWEEQQAVDQNDLKDIRGHTAVDGLAKQAAKLPMPDCNPAGPHSIVLNGAAAPTPAKKGVSGFRRYGT